MQIMNDEVRAEVEAMRGGYALAQVAIPLDDLKTYTEKQVDTRYCSLARAYLNAGLYEAVRQCMIDNGGKRYQCTRKWAEAATEAVWNTLRDSIPSGHPLSGSFCEHSTRVVIERDPYRDPLIRFRCLYRINGNGTFNDYGDVCKVIPHTPDGERVATWHHIPSAGSQNLVAHFNRHHTAADGIDPNLDDPSELGALLAAKEASGDWTPYETVVWRDVEDAQSRVGDTVDITASAARDYICQRRTVTVTAVDGSFN